MHEIETKNIQLSRNNITTIWILLWTLLGLLQTFRLYYAYNVFNEGIISWQKSALWAFTEWYLWGLLAIIIFKAIQFLQTNNKSLLTKLIWFVAGLVTFPAIHLFLYSVVWFITRDIFPVDIGTSYTNVTDIFLGSYLGKVNDNSIAYFLIVAAIYAFTYYKKLYVEQARLAEMNRLLAESKLEHLKTQLHPHFLFNTLNSITALIHTDPNRADLMTTKLSELLRISLNADKLQEITLKEELRILAIYLEIQQVRFEDRLKVSYDIHPDTENLLVPFLILQPIVENAIKHGIAQNSEQGKINITTSIISEKLVISIKNSGPLLKQNFELSQSSGVGLSNTKIRLEQLFNDDASISIKNIESSGVEVFIIIPARKE